MCISFSDINECEPRINICDENAQCLNTDGSFDCTCNQGFFGNGTICSKYNVVFGVPANNLNVNCDFVLVQEC